MDSRFTRVSEFLTCIMTHPGPWTSVEDGLIRIGGVDSRPLTLANYKTIADELANAIQTMILPSSAGFSTRASLSSRGLLYSPSLITGESVSVPINANMTINSQIETIHRKGGCVEVLIHVNNSLDTTKMLAPAILTSIRMVLSPPADSTYVRWYTPNADPYNTVSKWHGRF